MAFYLDYMLMLFRLYLGCISCSHLSQRYIPPTWTYECDEDLVHYFYDHIGKEDENLGSVKQCVTSIDVSSSSVRDTLILNLIYGFMACAHFNEFFKDCKIKIYMYIKTLYIC